MRLMGVIHPPGAAPEAAVYLKLRVLHTFLHELSHHYDHTFRLHGDRWRKDDKRKVEGYAERRSHHLVRDVVVPYLRERYPAEHEAFQEWLVRHGGGRIDLSDLADEDGAESPAQALIIDLVDDLLDVGRGWGSMVVSSSNGLMNEPGSGSKPSSPTTTEELFGGRPP